MSMAGYTAVAIGSTVCMCVHMYEASMYADGCVIGFLDGVTRMNYILLIQILGVENYI